MPQKTLKIALGVTYKEGAEVDDERLMLDAAGVVRHLKGSDGVENVDVILTEVGEAKTKAEREQARRDRDETIGKVLDKLGMRVAQPVKPGEKCPICGEVHEPEPQDLRPDASQGQNGGARQPTDAGGPVNFDGPLKQ